MSNQESREAAGSMDGAPARPLPRRGLIFENRVPTRRRRRMNAMERLLGIVDAHLELEPDKPFDYVRARRRLGVSSATMTKIKNRLREAKYPLPLSVREHERAMHPARRSHRANPNLDRDAIMAERKKVEAIVIGLRNQGESLRSIAVALSQMPDIKPVSETTVGRIVKAAVGSGKIIIDSTLSDREVAIRNSYNSGRTYPEIAKEIGEEVPWRINHDLERLEHKGEITRRKKFQGKKDRATNLS